MNRRQAAAFRQDVLERDNFTCIDCRRRLPESMLEADHDAELTDGGPNDVANGVTRCLDCHDDKTQERRMTRTATKKPTRGKKAAATAQLPDKPTFAVAPLVGAAFLAASATGVSYLLAPEYVRVPFLAWCAVVALALIAHGARLRHWRRICEAQRVYERLCKVAAAPFAARKHNFKVTAWSGIEPREATIRYGVDFDPADPRACAKLAEAFARATGVSPERVRTTALRAGRMRLSTTTDDGQGERAQQDDPAERAPDAATTVARGDVTTRLTGALSAALDDTPVEVAVTDWHGDGTPAALNLDYPSRATSRIGENLVRVRDTLGRLYAPNNDEWHIAWESHIDRLVLTDRPDPLAPVVPLPAQEERPNLVDGVIIGRTEDGSPWRFPLMGGVHTLVAGASGSGKGSILWGVIRGLEHMIAAKLVRLWIIDPKGGAEFTEAKPYAYRFAVDDDDSLELLEEACSTLSRKAAAVAGTGDRKVSELTPEFPLDLVIIDELAALTDHHDNKVKAATLAFTSKIMRQGRSPAFTLIGATQDPRKEVVKNRSAYTGALALRLSEAGETNLILGRGARADGAVADLIPVAHPGIGYSVIDGKARFVRGRAAFVSDEETRALAARITGRARPAPEHAARAMGEQLILDAPRTREPVAVGEVLSHANTPTVEPKSEPARADEPTPAPVPMRALEPGAHVLLPDDTDPVRVVAAEPDPDDEDTRVEVTYVYDGETGERVASFERSDLATPV